MPSDPFQAFSSILRDLVNQAVTQRIAQPVWTPPQVFSANQAAKRAKRRRDIVTKAIRSGALPAQVTGKMHRITEDALRGWINAGTPVEVQS